MYDRGLAVLEQYGLEATNTYRGRGALICDTEAGLVLIKEFTGSSKKLAHQAQLQRQLEISTPDISIDTLLPNQEGVYLSTDKDNRKPNQHATLENKVQFQKSNCNYKTHLYSDSQEQSRCFC